MIKKMPIISLLLLLLLHAMPISAHSGEITVKSGKFDHFNIVIPDHISAGVNAQIRLSAMDSLNNNITDFGDTKKNFTVSVTGSAVATPASFSSDSLTNGALIITINDKIAEPLSLSITEGDNPLPILTREFLIIPNKLSALVVKGPRTVFAGERFELIITEKDAFGNTAQEPVYDKNLNISFTGSSEPKPETLLMPEFRNGIGVIGFIAEKAGTVAIGIKDMDTGVSGTSERIAVKNGPLHSFRLLYPRDVIAGEPFDFSIFPIDRFGNILSNYAAIGNGVVITSSGTQKPFPSTIPAYEFVNGQVKVALRYDGAETVKIGVSEIGTNQTSESENIVFAPPIAERFEITTPDSVIAGQKFKIKITAYNQLSHIIRNYSLIGTDVWLSTTGTGNLMPNRIPASEFVNGVAIVDVQYNKSESFEIIATAEKPKESANIAGASLETIRQKISKKVKKEGSEIKKIAEIKNVSLKEEKDKTILTVTVDSASNRWKYKVNTEEKYDGKKWIVLKIKPAVSKIEKMPKVESQLVGNVVIEKDKKDKDAEMVKIELLKSAHYHLIKKNNALDIEVKK